MGQTVIKGARVFDGRTFIGERDVFINDDQIAGVGTHLEVTDAEVVDARGMTLLPGFIDCHVHTFGGHLVEALTFGVTTVIDMFTDVGLVQAWSKEQAQGTATGRADIVSAGNLATAPGGHGTQYGIKIATLTTPEEADDFVKARIEEGSHFIKIIWEKGPGNWPTLDEPTIAAVIEAARRHGKLSVIHVTEYKNAVRAIEMGVDGLAHIFANEKPADNFGSIAASAGTFVVPTLSVVASSCGILTGKELVDHDVFDPLLTPGQAQSLSNRTPWRGDRDFANAQRAVQLLVAAGVRVLAGTDAANPGTTHGASMHKEIELLTECGMSIEQALASATSLPAEVFGLDDRGQVASGKRADLMLVDGDPSSKLSDTRNLFAIWKEGVRFDLEARRTAMAELRTASEVKPPVPEGLGDGLISDFEDGLSAKFGAGWMVTSDSVMGGASEAALGVVADGAAGSAQCLLVRGEVREGYLFAWAGAMFCPGPASMQPADLSSKSAISFASKGEGQFTVGVMNKTGGFVPRTTTFQSKSEWSEHQVTFEQLGAAGSDVTAILFMCNERKPFELYLDDVRLV